jgi:methylated-DNA-[protein]-cysteine S-methyltransferase
MKFDEKVWMLMKKIPRGRVTTYGLIARKLNSHAYRAVGQACKRNPYAPKVPCHHVVESSGKVGNYSGLGGVKRKIQLLRKEGVKIKNKRIENFEKVLYKF